MEDAAGAGADVGLEVGLIDDAAAGQQLLGDQLRIAGCDAMRRMSRTPASISRMSSGAER